MLDALLNTAHPLDEFVTRTMPLPPKFWPAIMGMPPPLITVTLPPLVTVGWAVDHMSFAKKIERTKNGNKDMYVRECVRAHVCV